MASARTLTLGRMRRTVLGTVHAGMVILILNLYINDLTNRGVWYFLCPVEFPFHSPGVCNTVWSVSRVTRFPAFFMLPDLMMRRYCSHLYLSSILSFQEFGECYHGQNSNFDCYSDCLAKISNVTVYPRTDEGGTMSWNDVCIRIYACEMISSLRWAL